MIKITAVFQAVLPIIMVMIASAPLMSSTGVISQGLSGTPINIGAAVDMAYGFNSESEDGDKHGFEVRAVELNIGAPVDPYFDMVLTMSFHGGEFGLEEGFMSAILPFNLKLQAGKEFLPFGYLNRLHEHDFPQIDQPLVLEHLTTDHGLAGEGGHLEWIAPFINPTLTVNAGIYNRLGESIGARIDGYPFTARAQTFAESQGGSHAILMGISYVTGIGNRNNIHEFEWDQDVEPMPATKVKHGAGFDFKYRWSSTSRTKRGLTIAGEYLFFKYGKNEDDPAYNPDVKPGYDHGLYVYTHWDFNGFWGTGYRFDYMGLNELGDAGTVTAHSVYAEWRGTEFSRIRVQYQYADRGPDGIKEHRGFIQGVYFVGWHPPHRF